MRDARSRAPRRQQSGKGRLYCANSIECSEALDLTLAELRSSKRRVTFHVQAVRSRVYVFDGCQHGSVLDGLLVFGNRTALRILGKDGRDFRGPGRGHLEL